MRWPADDARRRLVTPHWAQPLRCDVCHRGRPPPDPFIYLGSRMPRPLATAARPYASRLRVVERQLRSRSGTTANAVSRSRAVGEQSRTLEDAMTASPHRAARCFVNGKEKRR